MNRTPPAKKVVAIFHRINIILKQLIKARFLLLQNRFIFKFHLPDEAESVAFL